MTDRGVLRARVDRDGRLVEADPVLLALNGRAGGTVGEPLAIGPVATLARLAARLGVLVARGVTVADDHADLDLWVRAEPGPDGVVLAIPDWRESRPWSPPPRPLAFEPAPPAPVPGAGQWEIDAALRLVALPADAAVRFGVDPAPFLGLALTQFVALEEGGGGDLPILSAMAGRAGFARQRARVRASGRAVLLAGTPRLDADGGFAGFRGTIEPAAEKGVSDAFGGRLDAALRAPLGRIVATADTIHAQADGPLGAGYVDYAADIASAGRHLLGLVDDLADLQAIERADFAPAAEPVDLADVARRAAGLLAVRAGDSGVAIDRPAPGDALPATGEFRRALQVMVNLVSNAVRYSPEGGTVWIRADRDGARAVVVVADQGKGIAAEDQERIFAKFERVDRSEPGGSGIGLYVARRLARAMGGDLVVDSAPGQGARFTFTLPLAG